MHSIAGYIALNFASSPKEKEDLALPLRTPPLVDDEKNNLFGEAGPDDVFRGYGLEEEGDGEQFDDRVIHNTRVCEPARTEQLTGAHRTRLLLERLAHRMREYKNFWQLPRDNQNIPAGYTYLAQLLAHDLVANIAPSARLDPKSALNQRDFRSEKLVLDTLYSGGPAANRLPYAIPEPGRRRTMRTKMRLGRPYAAENERTNWDSDTFADGIKPRPQARHDIPRTSCPFLDETSPKSTLSDPLLADPRNDDNLILSQLCTLFLELHNWIIERTDTDPVSRNIGVNDLRAYQHFLTVRKVVAYVFRRIVRKDLMRRFLDGEIYDRYFPDNSRPRCLDGVARMKNANRVPYEFSHAVFRFAHAMVRNDYVLNVGHRDLPHTKTASLKDILYRTSGRSKDLTPISCDWLVDWEMFFEIDSTGSTPNFSRTVTPDIGGGALMNDTFFANEHGVETGGLFYRDLLRGVEVGVRSVKSLIDELPPEDRKRSALLPDPGHDPQDPMPWQEPMSEWLEAADNNRFEGNDVQVLASDPPLFFFTLFESAHESQGSRLGILGSTIVAEVVADALRQSWDRIEGDQGVRDMVEAFFDGQVPATMPDLIERMMEDGRLGRTTCE